MATEGFETHLAELEKIVEDLESGELTLEGSLDRYQDGVSRLKACYELLKDAEDKVKVLVRDSDGDLTEEPFAESEEA